MDRKTVTSLPSSSLSGCRKYRDRETGQSSVILAAAPHFQSRGPSKISEEIVALFPKRLQQEQAPRERKPFTCIWYVWILWKLTGLTAVTSGDLGGPRCLSEFPSWKSTTLPGRERVRELLQTSGCVGLSFIWNWKRKITTEANNLVQWGWKKAAQKACGQHSVSVQ